MLVPATIKVYSVKRVVVSLVCTRPSRQSKSFKGLIAAYTVILFINLRCAWGTLLKLIIINLRRAWGILLKLIYQLTLCLRDTLKASLHKFPCCLLLVIFHKKQTIADPYLLIKVKTFHHCVIQLICSLKDNNHTDCIRKKRWNCIHSILLTRSWDITIWLKIKRSTNHLVHFPALLCRCYSINYWFLLLHNRHNTP